MAGRRARGKATRRGLLSRWGVGFGGSKLVRRKGARATRARKLGTILDIRRYGKGW